ncbi:Fumarate hydratase class II 2 [Methanobacterium sp. MB1]|nr:Fumarate hydratase class II 2 [Methanobacterium sp. MB1]
MGVDWVGEFRIERDSLGEVKVPAEKLWGAQTQRSLEYFSIGHDLMPKEMIKSYALIKKTSARVNFKFGLLKNNQMDLIVQVCEEILQGQHQDQFPLFVWMTGSGTHFNMNINEVIANRSSQLTGNPLGSKIPVHPNDHVNLSQSSNDSFPSAMNMSAAIKTNKDLIPELNKLRESLDKKAKEWMEIIKVGRTHMQDATPLTLGQEFSGYVGLLDDDILRIENSLKDVYKLALGGTAVGTGINAPSGFDEEVASEIAKLTGLPFKTAPNKFTVQGSHDALVMLSSTLKTLATSLYKIANDIRLLSCGPRCGFNELHIPVNEPGSSIMPGKVNPSQCEALTMIAVQVMANDMAVSLGGGGGYLEMNVYKPLIIYNILHSMEILVDGCRNFRLFLVEGLEPNKKQIKLFLNRSLMQLTALSRVIGYDRAAEVANYALDNDLTLKEVVLKLGYVSEDEFNCIFNPQNMIHPLDL